DSLLPKKYQKKGNPDDLGDKAWQAGREWAGPGGADTSGVANARVVHYGFLKWYNDQRPEDLRSERSVGSGKRWTKEYLEKLFRQGYGSVRSKNPESYEGPEGIEVAKEDGEWVVKRHGHITSRHATRDQAGARAEADANLARGSVRRLFKRNPDSDAISSSTTLLCSNEDGNQLYLLGGDQSLDLSSIHMDGDWERDSMVIGVVCEVTYRTEKEFDKFQLTDYYHRLGEETGDEPMLRYDRMNEKLYIDGGKYRIERPLVGVSPGIEN
ncbi:MAG: hypothetical protein OK436_07365, partial [Thaumarchaeota archaeon]|nr:hypothetical protein [Nitrososphaerota archaeon]